MAKKEIIAALAVSAAVAGGYIFELSPNFGAANSAQAASAPTVAAARPSVIVAAATQRRVTEWDRYPARFAATDDVEVTARVSGHITKIHFTDGQMVRAGDPLFTLDQRPFRAALTMAESAVAEAQARVSLAEVELDRTLQLEERGHVAQAQGDIARAEMAGAIAALSAARAGVAQAQLNLDYTVVRAPIAGRVDAAALDVGALARGIDTGSTILTSIVALDPIHVVFDVDQNALLKYNRLAQEGVRGSSRTTANPVQITLPDGSKLQGEGRMDFVGNSIDAGTGTIRARAIIDNPDLLLTPGMFASVDLLSRPAVPTVLIPDQAIATEQTSQTVLVVNAEGQVENRIIETGPLHEGLRIVRAGLQPGEQVIVEGRHRTGPGGTVTAELINEDIQLARASRAAN